MRARAGEGASASTLRVAPLTRPSPASGKMRRRRASSRLQLVFILEQVLNGLLVGAYYLLIALGLSLIFSLGGIVNLAHGAFYAIGAYLAVILADRSASPARFVVSPVLVGLLGVVIERLLFRRFYRVRPDPLAAADLRARDGGRAGAAHDLRRGAAAVLDPAGAARPVLRRRLHLSALPPAHARASRSPPCARPGSCSTARRSAASCARACRTPTWSARSASRSSPT